MKKLLITICFFAASCYGVDNLTNSFNAGELSPYLSGRTDVSKYFNGCKELENFFVLTHGGATKRSGTYYIASTKNADKKARLVSFEYNADTAYILEFGDEYIRFYMNGGQILNGSTPYEIVSPYDINDVFKLQFCQSADTMYIAELNYPVYKLIRSDHNDWDINQVDFKRGAFKDKNLTDTTITLVGDGNTVGNTVRLLASDDLWNANHVGGLWELIHTLQSVTVNKTFTSDSCSTTTTVQLNRTYHWTTHGSWTGTIFLEKSYDDGVTWLQVKPFDNKAESNISFSEEETVADSIYRVRMDYTSGTCYSSLVVSTFEEKGEVLITTYTDANEVSGTVHNVITSNAETKEWAEGAWSTDEGYPATITVFEERLCFGGTKNQPQTMWLSVNNDWENFYQSSADDTALTYLLASDQLNAIRWLIGQNSLMIGTSGSEWKLTINDDGIPKCYRQSAYGSADIQAILVNSVILYVQKQNRKVRELAYSYDLDSYVSPDLTIMSDHITKGGITQIAYQRTPDPMLWCVTDGNLAVMTYNRDQEVIAWQRINVSGYVESVAVIPHGLEDEVWIEVKRTIDGSDVRYIEKFMPREFTDVKDAFYVDSGLSYDGGDAVTITGITQANPCVVTAAAHGFTDGEQIRFHDIGGMTELNERVYTVNSPTTDSFSLRDETDTVNITSVGFTAYTSGGTVEAVENRFTTLSHLEGESVQICGDGGYIGDDTVAGGTIALDDYYNKVHIGLGYTAKLVPEKLEFQGNMTMTKVKNIRTLTLRLYNSLYCKAGRSLTKYRTFDFRTTSSDWDEPLPMYTGDKKIEFDGDYSTGGDIYLWNDAPLPLTILAIVPELDLQAQQ